MNIEISHENDLPELVSLQVHRDTYLSQQRTDELCMLLWKKYPELVGLLAHEAKYPFPDCRIGRFRSLIEELHIFFREEEKEGNIESLSLIQMVDLSWEVDRRIRKGIGVEEAPICGSSFIVDPSGPFPEWPEGKMSSYPAKGMTQELSDELSKKIYEYLVENQPEVLFAMTENDRRVLQEGEPDLLVQSIAKKLTPEEYGLPARAAYTEFTARLSRQYLDLSKLRGE